MPLFRIGHFEKQQLTPIDIDPYSILGLKKDADLEQVKSAYRRLVRLWHPDVCGRSMENIKRFLAIKDAYLLLKKRLVVQTSESQTVKSVSQRDYPCGENISTEGTFLFVQIGLKEALYGTSVSIEIADGQEFCRKCNGLGKIAKANLPPCPSCNGKGYKTLSWGEKDLKIICSHCSGRGRDRLASCPDCSGRGLVTRKKKIEVKIPQGTRNGTILQINQSFDSDNQASEDGCFLEVEVDMPKGWIIHGKDIISTVDVDCWTKLGGGYLEVETVDGLEKIFINPGLGNERFIRIKNKGWIDKKGKRGDHLVRLNVLSPKGPCPKEALELILKLKDLWPCDSQLSKALPNPTSNFK